MCLGGHLAFRAAFDSRVLAAVCFFGTDIHSETLGKGKSDSLKRVKDIKGELVMIFGKKVFPNYIELIVGSPCSARGEGFDSKDASRSGSNVFFL